MIILRADYSNSYIIPADMLPMLPHMTKVKQVGDKWVKDKLELDVKITDSELVTDRDTSELLKAQEAFKNMEGSKNYYENRVKELEAKLKGS